MKRRVLLARALVSSPDLLLLDEPTNHLDIEAIDWLEGFLKSFNGSIVFVTHDVEEAVYLASRVVVMTAGPGRAATEVAIEAPLPRPAGFRATELFRNAVEDITEALDAAARRVA